MIKALKKIHLKLLPIINLPTIITSLKNIPRYFKFLVNYINYKKLSEHENISLFDIYPCLNDQSSDSQTGKGHYFYQDLWALKHIYKTSPKIHIDIGSRIDGFSAQCSVICPVEFIDYRPVNLRIDNFKMVQGLITNLPYESKSVSSISSLHVVEHIGLGRYGDPVDPQGSHNAIKELQRVLAPGGALLFSVPIGKERVQFNAHRIFNPKTIIDEFDELKLTSFSVIDDNNNFQQNTDFAKDWSNQQYACGLFSFTREHD